MVAFALGNWAPRQERDFPHIACVLGIFYLLLEIPLATVLVPQEADLQV